MKKKTTTQVMVLVAESHHAKLGEMEKSLRSAGMSGIQRQDTIGTLTGEAEKKALARLRRIPGVAAVEESQQIQLPPPDAEIQ
jgi:hypothetical protein